MSALTLETIREISKIIPLPTKPEFLNNIKLGDVNQPELEEMIRNANLAVEYLHEYAGRINNQHAKPNGREELTNLEQMLTLLNMLGMQLDSHIEVATANSTAETLQSLTHIYYATKEFINFIYVIIKEAVTLLFNQVVK